MSDTLASSTKYTNIKAKPDLPKSPQKSHVAHPLQSSPVKMSGKLYGDKDRYAKQKSVSLPEPVAVQVYIGIFELYHEKICLWGF